MTGVNGDIITGEVITDTDTSIMNVEDVNEDGSVNLSWDRDTDDDGVNDEDASVLMDLSLFHFIAIGIIILSRGLRLEEVDGSIPRRYLNSTPSVNVNY